VDEFPITSLGIVPVRYRPGKGRFPALGASRHNNHSVSLPFLRAAVGSTNPAKVEAVRRTLARFAPECFVESIDVPSGVGNMPLGENAIRAGALARARAALEKTDAEIAFGLEGGAILDGERAWLTGNVIALTRDGRIGEAAWGRMLLPIAAAERVRNGEELGDIIDDLFGAKESKRHAGAIGLLTDGAVSRTDAFADHVAMACAPFLHPELYGGTEDA
jgi:inosine/xanthosine triphosphatase